MRPDRPVLLPLLACLLASGLLLAPSLGSAVGSADEAAILYQSWPGLQIQSWRWRGFENREVVPLWDLTNVGGFVGGSVGTRYEDGELYILPGARGPDSGGTSPFEAPVIPILSWSEVLGAFSAGSVATTLDMGGDASVWIPTPGTLSECMTEDGLTFCFDFPFAVDGRGRISGTGSLTLSGSADGLPVSGALTGALSGKLKRRPGQSATLLKLKVKLTGDVDVGGLPIPMRFKVKMKSWVHEDGTVCDPTYTEACTSGDLKLVMVARIPGARNVREVVKTPYAAELPKDDGIWRLGLIASSDGRKLDGSATAALGATDLPYVVDFDVNGRYKARRDWSRVKLRAQGMRGKVKFKRLRASEDGLEEALMIFNLFGQKGKMWVPDPSCCSTP